MLCIFSVRADIPSWRMGKMNTLKEERLAVSREPQTSRPMRLVQTLLWSNLWANLDTEADISQAGEETWCHHQLLHCPIYDSLTPLSSGPRSTITIRNSGQNRSLIVPWEHFTHNRPEHRKELTLRNYVPHTNQYVSQCCLRDIFKTWQMSCQISSPFTNPGISM